MKNLTACRDSTELFQIAVEQVADYVQPERAMLLTRVSPGNPLQLRAGLGVEKRNFETHGVVSFELLERVADDGQAIMLEDACEDPRFRESSSVVLAGLKSVLCAPFKGTSGQVEGVLYADCPSRSSAFTYTNLMQVMQVVSQLERCLVGVREPARRETADNEVSRPRAQFGPRPGHRNESHEAQVKVAQRQAPRKVSAGASARFLRSLATMIGAGVSFLRALELLSDQSEEEGISQISLELSSDLRAGQRLSYAFSRHPGIFSPITVQMIKMGEDSGSLARVLQELARYEEKRYGLVQKLRSQLVYPAFLLTASLLMAVIGPPYLLGNILELLNSYEVALSPLTRAIMLLSEASTDPLVWLVGVATAISAGLLGRKLLQRSEVRLQLATLVSALPYVGSIIQKLTLTRVASALALQLRSGTSPLKALQVALKLSGNPVVEARSQAVQQALKDGDTVVDALSYAHYFPGYFLAMVEVGVSSGNLDGSMAWLAEFCEQEFERDLEAMAAVIEPFMMLVMGIIVAVMLVGTMLPFVQLLQSL